MSADWLSLIVVNVFMSPSPPGRATFGTPLFLVDQDDGNSLNGSRVVQFSGAVDAQQANSAGYISSLTLAALNASFGQQPAPQKIKVAYRDTGANETIAAALSAILAVDTAWYGIAQDSREAADVSAMAAAVESIAGGQGGVRRFYVGQSSDASLLDASLPAGLSTLAGKERTALVYHATDTAPADLAWLASRLVSNPDTQSAGWEGGVRNIAASPLTSGQRDLAVENNVNVGLPFSTANYFVSPGVNMNGRSIYEILSADWYQARVSEDLAYLKLAHSERREKLLVNADGQTKIMAVLNTWLLIGEDVGHFERGQTRVTPEDITDADRTAKRLRFRVEAMIAGDVREMEINVYMQPGPLASIAA